MNAFLMLAAAASLITCLVHVAAGGYFVTKPLLAEPNLTRSVKFTVYFAWHMASVILLAMAACFAYAAYDGTAGVLAVFMTILAAAFAVLNVGLIAAHKLSPLFLPHWLLFAAIATLGFIGILQ